MKLWLVSACILCASISAVLALQCQLCTNVPGFTAVSSCKSQQIGSITCGANLNRCMTLKTTVSVAGRPPFNLEVRNCSTSQVCNRKSRFHVCKLLRNARGRPRFRVTKCKSNCCTGNLCNNPAYGISSMIQKILT